MLVDRARAKLSVKRQGGQRVYLPDIAATLPDGPLPALATAMRPTGDFESPATVRL